MEEIGKIHPIVALAEIYRSGLTNEIMAIAKKYSPKDDCAFLRGENNLFRISALCAIYNFIKNGGKIDSPEKICVICKQQKVQEKEKKSKMN